MSKADEILRRHRAQKSKLKKVTPQVVTEAEDEAEPHRPGEEVLYVDAYGKSVYGPPKKPLQHGDFFVHVNSAGQVRQFKMVSKKRQRREQNTEKLHAVFVRE